MMLSASGISLWEQSLRRRKTLSLGLTFLFVGLLLGAWVVSAQTSTSVYLGGAWTVATEDGVSFYSKNPYGDVVYVGLDEAAAINSVIASDRWVQIRVGCYELSSSVVIDGASDLRISGDGRVATKLKAANGLNDNVITIRDSTHVTIEALTVDGNKDNNVLGNGIDIAGTLGHYCSNIIVDKVQVLSCKQSGIVISDLGGIFTGILFVTNSMVDFNGDDGYGAGVYLAAPDCIISGNDIGKNNMGIVNYAGASSISNNHVWGSTSVGVGVFSGSFHTRVEGNRLDYNLQEGLYLNDTSVVAVTGNEIRLNGQHKPNTYAGVKIVGSASDPIDGVTFVGNIIGSDFSTAESQKYGVTVSGGAHATHILIGANNFRLAATANLIVSWDNATCREIGNLGAL